MKVKALKLQSQHWPPLPAPDKPTPSPFWGCLFRADEKGLKLSLSTGTSCPPPPPKAHAAPSWGCLFQADELELSQGVRHRPSSDAQGPTHLSTSLPLQVAPGPLAVPSPKGDCATLHQPWHPLSMSETHGP